MKRDILVATAMNYLGAKELDHKHRELVDVYNTLEPVPRGYYVTPADPWCAIFVSACIKLAGLDKALPTECSCTEMLLAYKTNPKFGAVVKEADPKLANLERGDLVFYGKSGSPANTSEHVGIITNVLPSSWDTIEGNWRNGVNIRQHIGRSWDGIKAYVKPNYPDEAWEKEKAEAKAWVVQNEIIKGDENGIDWSQYINLERLAVILKRLCT